MSLHGYHNLRLYMTEDCHLCENAQQIIYQVLGTTVSEIDIADDDELMARYGIRIPVLQQIDSRRELNWPFSSQDVNDFIDAST